MITLPILTALLPTGQRFFTGADVLRHCAMKAHELRALEQAFPQLTPPKHRHHPKQRLYYQRHELELLLQVRHWLLYEQLNNAEVNERLRQLNTSLLLTSTLFNKNKDKDKDKDNLINIHNANHTNHTMDVSNAMASDVPNIDIIDTIDTIDVINNLNINTNNNNNNNTNINVDNLRKLNTVRSELLALIQLLRPYTAT